MLKEQINDKEVVLSDVVYDDIIHISDIHIRLSSRFEEYESVLKKFLDKVKHLEKAIVVITGDIFHHKNELTPDCIMFVISFFRRISKIHPLVIIPGNHDFLMNNLEKNDSITSVLFRRNLKNVYYLKESGCYRFGNILFVHNSLWNPNNREWILPSTIKKTNEKDIIVSLYHGMVGKCKILSGYTFQTSETLSVSHFSGSDFVLLGDIHHHQYIQENMAYAGSLISQNFNETNDEHGFILWNVHTKSSTFHKIENEYAYRRIDMFPQEDRILFLDKSWNDLSNIIDMIHKNNRLEIHIHNDEHYDSLPIRKMFQTKGIHPRIRYNHSSNMEISSVMTDHSYTNEIQDPHSLTNLLHEYLAIQHDSLQKNKDELKYIIETITKNVDAFQRNHTPKTSNHSLEKQSWRILDISFDFLFGYGSNNRITFQKHEVPQLIGIFGNNSAGKSTVIDIILFMLYGRITRYASGNSVPQEVIHEKQDHFCAKLRFKVGQHIYSIEKKGKRNKKTSKIKIEEELWRESTDGSRVNMSEEHRMKTDKMICDLIGSIDQFMYLSLCTQTPCKSFREMTQKERKEFLIMLFGLDSFEIYYNILNTEMKQFEIEEKSLMIVREKSEIVEEHEWTKQLMSMTKELQKAKDELTQSEKYGKELREKFVLFSEMRSRRDQLDLQIVKRKEKYLKCQERFNTIQTEEVLSNGDMDMDIDKIQKRLQRKRREMADMRDKIHVLRKDWRSLPPAPTCENFSFIRWNVLRKKFSSPVGEHFKSVQPKNISVRRRITSDRDIEDTKFVYFDYSKVKEMENMMNECEKICIPNIKSLFETIGNHESELIFATRTIETIQEEYSIHENVEYDESCEKCKSNPFRARKQELEKRMQDVHRQQEKLNKKISGKKEKLKKEIVDCLEHFTDFVDMKGDILWSSMEFFSKRWEKIRQEVYRRWNRIEEFQEEINGFLSNRLEEMKRLERQEYEKMTTFVEKLSSFMSCKIRNAIVEREEKLLSKKLEKSENDCAKYESMITTCARQVEGERLQRDMERMGEEEKEDKEERLKIVETLEGLGDVANRVQNHQEVVLKQSRQVSVMEKDIEFYKLQFEDWRRNGEKLQKIREIITRQRILLSICNRKGFPSHILRTIVPIFGGYMNRILNHFTDRYVQFDMNNEGGDIIFQTRSNDSDMSFHFYGGMESFMIDLATKITFAHFGYCPMSSFFVLDENISVLDEYHVQHIEILFSFLKQHFQHILLISHLPSIKNIVDKDISIVKEDGYSHVHCQL